MEDLLKLEKISFSVRGSDILSDVELTISRGDAVAVYGRNGSGKSILAEIAAGRIKAGSGRIIRDEGCRVSVVSSEEKKRMLDEDRYNDDTDFLQGAIDPGRTVERILRDISEERVSSDELEAYIEEFGIGHILNRGIKFLSTGEFRKMMIVRALCEKPDLLILDDPFTGLDISTRRELESLFPALSANTGALMVLSGRRKDFGFCGINRSFILEDGQLREEAADEVTEGRTSTMHGTDTGSRSRTADEDQPELVRMESVSLSYYEEKILNDINWTVTEGSHWQISGPNGSGKSTLLSLVNGDSPKAYGQQLYLFGLKRGSGETVWDIKKQIGTVSGALQQNYRINQSVLSVVCSGFFDTIGLYDKPDPVQLEKAKHLCGVYGLSDILEKPFSSLSDGLKRAVLTVRAVIKQPRIIILDEPCQGLDDYNSEFVLNAARTLIDTSGATLLYVSHDPDYIIEGITDRFELVPHTEGGFTGRLG